jgi:predicted RNA polymerase sigma factor
VGYVDDEAIRFLLTRLARAHPSGGVVIERAAIVAEGTGSEEVLAWMMAHGAEPEATVATRARRGLHGSDLHAMGGSERSVPSRYILPAGALDPS